MLLRFFAVAGLLGIFSGFALAGSTELAGEWSLCHDEGGNPKDSLHLNADGSGVVRSPRGKTTPFSYSVDREEVRVSIPVNRREIIIVFSITEDGRLLMTEPPGETYYVPVKRESAFSCTAR